MKKGNNLRYFISKLNLLLGTSFFYSQSGFSEVFKDTLFNLFLNLKWNKKTFIPFTGSAKTTPPIFDLNNAKVRGNSDSISSFSYTTNEFVEPIFHEIIFENRKLIEEYLGKNFIYEAPLYFRNLNIPLEFQNYDVYSNVWHQDSHDGDMLLKIFILLSDVGPDDGPFMYLDRNQTKKYWNELRDRWSFSKFKQIPVIPGEQRAIGKKGDFLIVNTANCMHRASVPNEKRDMAQITLYPKWRKNSTRKQYNFK
jgi:hypothetical protein